MIGKPTLNKILKYYISRDESIRKNIEGIIS